MTILWWTLYILGALTAIITWFNVMILLGRLFKIIHDKEWMQVKVIEGPPGPQGPQGPRGYTGEQGPSGDFVISSDLRRLVETKVKAVLDNRGILSRKDIESLIRMEVAAHLSKFAISHTSFPGLGNEETKIATKNLGDWQTNQSKVDVDKLIAEYRESKEDK